MGMKSLEPFTAHPLLVLEKLKKMETLQTLPCIGNKKNLFTLLFLCLVGFANAQNTPIETSEDCGKLITYTCDADYLKGSDKQDIFFRINVPEGLQVQTLKDQKRSYFRIQKLEDGAVDEFVSFGHLYNSEGMTEEEIIDRLYGVSDMIINAGYTEDESQLLKTTFDGKEYHVYQAIGTFPESAGPFAGEFLYNVVALPYDDQRTLLVVMMANNKGHDYKFYDFADRMCISHIWRSIEFLH